MQQTWRRIVIGTAAVVVVLVVSACQPRTVEAQAQGEKQPSPSQDSPKGNASSPSPIAAMGQTAPLPCTGTAGTVSGKDYVCHEFAGSDGTKYKVVVGSIGGATGITAPSEATTKVAALGHTHERLSNGTEVIVLTSGWARVFVTPAGPLGGCPPTNLKEPLFPTPWRLVVMRGMATGAYGSNYTASATPENGQPDGVRQMSFSEDGCNVVVRKGGTEQDQKAVAPGKRALLLGNTISIDPTRGEDKTNFLAEAKGVFEGASCVASPGKQGR